MWGDGWGVMILRPKLHCWLACFSPRKHNCYEFLCATTLSWTEDFILQSLSWPLAPIFPMFISFTMSFEQALIDSLNRMNPIGLQHLKIWSPTGGTAWVGLADVVLLEELSHFEVSKVSSQIQCMLCFLSFKIWALNWSLSNLLVYCHACLPGWW